jgi:hypothetical protein
MSYDVYLEVDTGAGNYACIGDWNMTSNVAPMWRKAGADLAEMADMPAWRAADLLRGAVDMMRAYPADYEALNPANGWGDYEGCMGFLEVILRACERHPRAVLRVGH